MLAVAELGMVSLLAVLALVASSLLKIKLTLLRA